jgi:hypothetical protein
MSTKSEVGFALAAVVATVERNLLQPHVETITLTPTLTLTQSEFRWNPRRLTQRDKFSEKRVLANHGVSNQVILVRH